MHFLERSLRPWRKHGCRANSASGGLLRSGVRIIPGLQQMAITKLMFSAGQREVERERQRADEGGNDDRGERYETDSEDERRRYKQAYDTSDVKGRGLTTSDLEYSDHHDRFIRWDSDDDEGEEELGAEGEANE